MTREPFNPDAIAWTLARVQDLRRRGYGLRFAPTVHGEQPVVVATIRKPGRPLPLEAFTVGSLQDDDVRRGLTMELAAAWEGNA